MQLYTGQADYLKGMKKRQRLEFAETTSYYDFLKDTVKLPADEASGIEKYRGELMEYLTATAKEDWKSRQDWQDIWNLNYKK